LSAPNEPLLRLDDYVTGEMPETEAAAFEEDLFAAAADADPSVDVFKASGLAADAGFLERLARWASHPNEQAFANGAPRAQIDALLGSGLPVHYVDLGAGGAPVPFVPWKPGVKIVVARLGVDLRGWQDVDVEVAAADGTPVKTFRDVHCAPEDGALYAVCHEPLARLAFARGRTISRVVGTRGGARETVAVFDVQPAAF
jgi:hypothetical protein